MILTILTYFIIFASAILLGFLLLMLIVGIVLADKNLEEDSQKKETKILERK